MDELRRIVLRAGTTWTETGLPRVRMVRAEACSDQVYEATIHLVLQGTKTLSIGDQLLQLAPATYFVVPVEVPAFGRVRSAAPVSPYLAVSLRLDPAVISAVLADGRVDPAEAGAGPQGAGFSASAATPEMIDAWLRLMRLIDRPKEAAMLAPMLEREIIFRALQGPQGGVLRQIGRADSRLSQVRHVVAWIREHHAEPFRVGPLAAMAGMSVAGFYRHFKAVTAMSPIQYQKQLRLLQARRRLLFESGDAASVAFSVGYASVSQFSREYARMFGLPPARDAARWKAPAAASRRARPTVGT